MFSLRVMMMFFDRGFILRILMIGLLCSLVPLAEIGIFLYLSGFAGRYLLLGSAACTALLGVGLVIRSFHVVSRSLSEKVHDGQFPQEEFYALAGLMFAGILLVFPGFLTDVIGVLAFFPLVRNSIGKKLVSGMDDRLKEVYEYLKMTA